MGAPATEDVAELRRRLDEAEETLAAIREGRVDALVMRGEERDEVFSLVGGGESYRSFMEVMETGAAALDGEGRLLYANAALCDLLCLSASELGERGLLAALGAATAARLAPLMAGAGQRKQVAEATLTCGRRDRHVVIAVAPLPLSFGKGFAVTVTDVTERVEAAAAEETERVGQAVMASANSAVVVCDGAGIVTHASTAVRAVCDGNPVGRPFAEAFPLQFAVGAGFMEAADVIAVGLAGNAVKSVETVLPGVRPRDLLVSVAPLRLAGGSVSGCAVTLVDLTERKAIEKRQALLMRELDHRVKNTLTLVLSIASRTIKGAADLRDFQEKFTRRIEALAATHNLLAEGADRQPGLDAVVAAELSPYVAAPGPRVSLSGLDVQVAPDTAIALGLVVHELVTNAVKYGALSNEEGAISLSGALADDGALELTWQERGGPPVTPPASSGFGQTLIARSLGSADGAGAAVEFAPAGVVCRMRIPAGEVARRGD